MSVQDILNNLQTIQSQGQYQVAPKLPAPKPVQPLNFGGLNFKQQSPVGSSVLDRLTSSIRQQESSGNYRATNPSGASGAYQILRSNFEGPGGWDKEALGRDVTYDQFINSPQLQDAIARYELSNYLNKYGAAGAAAAWYGGPGAVKLINSTNPQGQYPSISAYVKAIMARM
jgi:hypothetical protein